MGRCFFSVGFLLYAAPGPVGRAWTGPLLVFPVGRAKALPKLRMGAITLPYPQTPSLGAGALSLCSDFDTQRQAESSFCCIHPELYFRAQVELGSWPGWLTRQPDQPTAIRLPAPGYDLAFFKR